MAVNIFIHFTWIWIHSFLYVNHPFLLSVLFSFGWFFNENPLSTCVFSETAHAPSSLINICPLPQMVSGIMHHICLWVLCLWKKRKANTHWKNESCSSALPLNQMEYICLTVRLCVCLCVCVSVCPSVRPSSVRTYICRQAGRQAVRQAGWQAGR